MAIDICSRTERYWAADIEHMTLLTDDNLGLSQHTAEGVHGFSCLTDSYNVDRLMVVIIKFDYPVYAVALQFSYAIWTLQCWQNLSQQII